MYMPEQEAVQGLGFTVWNGPECHLAALALNGSDDDLLVVMPLPANEGFVHFHGTAETNSFLWEERIESPKPTPDGDVRMSRHRLRILQTEFSQPAVQQLPELFVGELGMCEGRTPFQGKLIPAYFTAESSCHLPGIPSLAARTPDAVGKERLSDLGLNLCLGEALCYVLHWNMG